MKLTIGKEPSAPPVRLTVRRDAEICKARPGLVKKTITDKRGKRTSVWVKAGKKAPAKKKGELPPHLKKAVAAYERRKKAGMATVAAGQPSSFTITTLEPEDIFPIPTEGDDDEADRLFEEAAALRRKAEATIREAQGLYRGRGTEFKMKEAQRLREKADKLERDAAAAQVGGKP